MFCFVSNHHRPRFRSHEMIVVVVVFSTFIYCKNIYKRLLVTWCDLIMRDYCLSIFRWRICNQIKSNSGCRSGLGSGDTVQLAQPSITLGKTHLIHKIKSFELIIMCYVICFVFKRPRDMFASTHIIRKLNFIQIKNSVEQSNQHIAPI